jgi:tetratricopeptide (TPR) repeat protein
MVAKLGNQISRANQISCTSSEDETIYEHLGSCITTAKKFLSSASVASSSASWTGTITPQIRRSGWTSNAEASEFGEILSPESRGRIESWVLPPDGGDIESPSGPGNATPFGDGPHANSSEEHEALAVPLRKTEDNDLDLDMTRNYLRLGQEKAEKQDHAGAEKYFRKAIERIETHNFHDRIALHLQEVQLMLGCACLKQNKFIEAEGTLLPLIEQDKGRDDYQSLTANHLLGEMYLLKGDLQRALSYTMVAVKGRDRLLGRKHAKFAESLRLLLQIYEAMGDEAEVEAWQTLLPAKPLVAEPVTASNGEEEVDQASDIFGSISTSLKVLPPTEKPGKRHFSLSFRKASRADSKKQRHESIDFLDAPPMPSESSASSVRSSKTMSPSLSPITTFAATSEHGYGDIDPFVDTTLSKSPTLNDVSLKSPSRPSPKPLAIRYNSVKLPQKQAATAAFAEIRDLCDHGDYKKAVKESLGFLRAYVDKSDIPFIPEITDNIRHSGKLGLAGTGRGYAPLHFFASLEVERSFEIELLIRHGVDVNATDLVAKDPRPSPDTALLLAAERGHAKIVQILLETPDIDIEHKGSNGMTALFVAFSCGRVKIVELLLRHGANAKVEENGLTITTLLHQAASRHDPETIRLLLERGEAVDALDRKSRTPLICALDASLVPARTPLSSARLIETTTILLEAGANCQLKDSDGNSAMSQALKGPSWEVVKLLEKRSAQATAAKPADISITWESLAHG